MSMNETYLLAARARSKLSYEANKQDHDLRRLVGHANLLDNVMDKIETHKEQLANETIYKTLNSVRFSPLSSKVTMIKEDEDDEEEEEEEEFDEEISQSPEILYDANEVSSDDESDDDEEEGEWFDYGASLVTVVDDYNMVKVSKVTSSNFRELVHYEDEEDDDLEDLEDYQSDGDDEIDLGEAVPALNYSSSDDEESDELDNEFELNEKTTQFWADISARDLLVERAHVKNRIIDNKQKSSIAV